ncbi:MAG: hypothetical protein J6I66_01500 [Lachnospiraceae bacterium]|nr:hypothetical protein [Lachnospiraceae bacterium]
MFSDYYLVGISIGGPSYGDDVTEAEGLAIICTDRSVQVYLPETDGAHTLKDYVLQDTCRDDTGKPLYYVCNFVSNGIEGAEHHYGLMYIEDDALHFDEISEEDMKPTGEKVTLGWFSEVTPENVYVSYNTFVN